MSLVSRHLHESTVPQSAGTGRQRTFTPGTILHPGVRIGLDDSPAADLLTEVLQGVVHGLVKERRDLPPVLRGDLLQVRREEVVGMLVGEPGVGVVPEVLELELRLGEKLPGVVEDPALEPRIAEASPGMGVEDAG